MAQRRVWVARVLVVLFTVVEVIAAAPELHLHPSTLAGDPSFQSVVHGTQLVAHEPPTNPVDCLACRVANLAMAFSFGPTLTPPTDHATRAFILPIPHFSSTRLDGVFGRAPPSV